MLNVSFVLATFNRGSILLDCLRHTLACADSVFGSGRFSISVIDNASTDGTPDLVAAFARERTEIHLIRLAENRGPVAKNESLRNATADLVILLDDDAYPLPGALRQMLRHFEEDARLAAAVFDVTLPDGTREASAYPDVFIGAGTALRRSALEEVSKNTDPLPAEFFMQAEEYDLSFRLVNAGWTVQRFWDMPLIHLKSPGARIAQRTTGLDVRNNLFVLARYVPDPLCGELGADWLARYWWMAQRRDELAGNIPHPEHGTHVQAYSRGVAEGMAAWEKQRAHATRLTPDAGERIFKWTAIRDRLQRAKEQLDLRRIALADLGKNTFAYYLAARALGLELVAIVDDDLGLETGRSYRGVPVIPHLPWTAPVDALVLTALSPVHAERRAGHWRRVVGTLPVIDVFSRRPLPIPQVR